MFELTPLLKTALIEREKNVFVDARILLIKSGVAFEEEPLPEGVHSIIQRDESKYKVIINNNLSPQILNQVCGHVLAHLILHSSLIPVGHSHTDLLEGYQNPFSEFECLGPKENTEANNMALEILIPTISLREQFLYTQGNISMMAKTFQLPEKLIHFSLIKTGLLDKISKIA